MKLHIEVTLSPSEIPLCTEFFHVLRQITDSVATRNNTALFAELLARLGRQPIPSTMSQEEQLEQVAADITALLDANGGSDDVVQQLFEAFITHVFGSGQTPVGAAPGALLYVFLLSRLADQYRTKMRDKLVPAILKFLTIKRSIDCDRREFFAYAEAFASLVKLEFVSITGAVTTITTLLQQNDTRCAAVTMLGKTVELCLSLLAEKCDPTQLATMRAALRGVTDDAFRYDISYIQENMGWTDAAAAAATTAATNAVIGGGAKAVTPAGATSSSSSASQQTTLPSSSSSAAAAVGSQVVGAGIVGGPSSAPSPISQLNNSSVGIVGGPSSVAASSSSTPSSSSSLSSSSSTIATSNTNNANNIPPTSSSASVIPAASSAASARVAVTNLSGMRVYCVVTASFEMLVTDFVFFHETKRIGFSCVFRAQSLLSSNDSRTRSDTLLHRPHEYDICIGL
jgi:hypothetical protein